MEKIYKPKKRRYKCYDQSVEDCTRPSNDPSLCTRSNAEVCNSTPMQSQSSKSEANVGDCFEISDDDADLCKPSTNAPNTFQTKPYSQHLWVSNSSCNEAMNTQGLAVNSFLCHTFRFALNWLCAWLSFLIQWYTHKSLNYLSVRTSQGDQRLCWSLQWPCRQPR